MRIIGGKYRGKKLFTPAGKEIRPTSDRAREALFNILYSQLGSLEGLHVLDVFAGTGAFGLEALSRGASFVTFVDKDVRLLNKNTGLFPAEKNKIGVISADVSFLPAAKTKAGLAFMDAPYAKSLSSLALSRLDEKGWLEKNALCLVEMRRDEKLIPPPGFEKCDTRVYGLAKIEFYRYHKEDCGKSGF